MKQKMARPRKPETKKPKNGCTKEQMSSKAGSSARAEHVLLLL